MAVLTPKAKAKAYSTLVKLPRSETLSPTLVLPATLSCPSPSLSNSASPLDFPPLDDPDLDERERGPDLDHDPDPFIPALSSISVSVVDSERSAS